MRLIVLLITPLFSLASCKLSEQATAPKDGRAHQHEWNLTHVGATDVQKIITDNPSIGIIDVRTPAEFAEGHIKGAINVDFKSSDFAKQISKANNHRSYIVYCRSGNRSRQSLPVLKNNNLGTVYHLEKGFNSWKDAGLPVER